jgi:hypothetical protein
VRDPGAGGAAQRLSRAVRDTRAGRIELEFPRSRKGSYVPSFQEPRRTAEKALPADTAGPLHASGRTLTFYRYPTKDLKNKVDHCHKAVKV